MGINDTGIHGQSQLQIDAGAISRFTKKRLLFGIAWYDHHHKQINTHALQGMMKWLF